MNALGLIPLLAVVCGPAGATATRPVPTPLVSTYSIVARDSVTGELGVAVQSHYFSVGPIVPWVEPGVGAVATQSLVLVDYGPKGLELMRQGLSAPQALDALTAIDANPAVRQVAMIDAKGRVAAHTGPLCIADAGHVAGEQFSVQANLMARPTVWAAMAKAYRETKGDLAERLLRALEAAEAEGGDIRGKQSAALVVVRGQPTGKPWLDRTMDLRVEDHADPLRELRRLVKLRRAYNHVDAGDNFIAEGKGEEALAAYAEGARLAPEVVELQFWAAVSMYQHGRKPEALQIFRRVFAREGRRWVDLIPRLAKSGLFPDDPAQIAEVQRQWPGHRAGMAGR